MDHKQLSLAITEAPILLFAGAGASVSLGLYTSRQFFDAARNIPHLDLASQQILQALSQLIQDDSHDLEGLVSTLLQAQASPDLELLTK